MTGCVLVLLGGDLLGEGDEVAAGVPDDEFFRAFSRRFKLNHKRARTFL